MSGLAIERVAHEGIGYGGHLAPDINDLARTVTNHVSDVISTATFVDARAVPEMLAHRNVQEIIDGPEPRMPWPAVWADFAMSPDDRDRGAVLACKASDREHVLAWVILAIRGLRPFVAGVTKWSEKLPFERCCQAGQSLRLFAVTKFNVETMDERIGRAGIRQLGGFLYLLRLLACRNITCAPAPDLLQPTISKRLSRRYGESNGGYRMHTVTIRLGRDKVAPLASLVPEMRDLPLHLVRGHFKHYSDEAPLFGKYTGWWWWTPQLRGSVHHGIVDKNYRIAADPLIGSGVSA